MKGKLLAALAGGADCLGVDNSGVRSTLCGVDSSQAVATCYLRTSREMLKKRS
jgi:hypothetical protein